jgi:hypothetical protein
MGTIAHIGEKVIEITPTLADRDAAASVIKVKFTGLSITSIPHGYPSLICASRSAIGCVTMLCLEVNTLLRGQSPL